MARILARWRGALRRDGLLRTMDRAWEKLFCHLAGWRLTNLLGRTRTAVLLPRWRGRFRGGKLNLGCGPDRRPGWLNADLGLVGDLHLDVSHRFPFPSDFFSFVFSEHLLEHLAERGAENCLCECYRVLQPGGALRVSTPDLQQVVADYLAPESDTEGERVEAGRASAWKYSGRAPTPAQALNDGFYLWEHRHLYDEKDLRVMLGAAGFTDIVRYPPGEGPTEQSRGLEGRIGKGSLVLQATKPLSD